MNYPALQADGVVHSPRKALEAETELRQNQYLNHVIEQDHRNVKRNVEPVMGFTFNTARRTL